MREALLPVGLAVVAILALLALSIGIFGRPSTYTGTVEKTYCNGSTGFCTTDKCDSRLKNPANSPIPPGVPAP